MGWSWPVGATISRLIRPYLTMAMSGALGYPAQRPELLGYQQPSGRSGRGRPLDRRTPPGNPVARVWGDGDPEGVRQRAAEEMKNTARAAAKFGVKQVNGFTGSPIWHLLYSFPPNNWETVEAGYREFADRWNPIMDVFDEVGREVRPGSPSY